MTSDAIDLWIGGTSVRFWRSERLVAVRSQPGRAREVRQALFGAAPPRPASDLGALAGFHIAEVDTRWAEGGEEALARLRRHPAVAEGAAVFHTSDDGVPFVATGAIHVAFREGADPEECQHLLEDLRLRIDEARPGGELIVQTTEHAESPLLIAARLQDSDLTELAEPELATPGKLAGHEPDPGPRSGPQELPSAAELDALWHLENRGAHRGASFGFKEGADARVVSAWRAAGTLGSPEVVVAVIDEAFDLSEPAWSGEKVVAPWDFRGNTGGGAWGSRGAAHGTACAALAVGPREGHRGMIGAAPSCRLMPIRWCGEISDRRLEAWFGHAMRNGAWVVSSSWSARARSFPLSTRAKRALRRCATEGRDGLGCVIVFAAGNEDRSIDDPEVGSLNGFATDPHVIAVAASTSMDVKADSSNFGRGISVCAPSSGAGGWSISPDMAGSVQGTSGACAVVAGVCALVLSVCPTLTAAQVKALVQRTARRIESESGPSVYHGHGCIDAHAAVAAAAQIAASAGASLQPNGAAAS